MNLPEPKVQRKIMSRVIVGDPKAFFIADWPEGQPLPPRVVQMIMDTWGGDEHWEEDDGAVLFVHETRRRGRRVTHEDYPLVLIDEHEELLYGYLSMYTLANHGQIMGATTLHAIHIVAEQHGFPPKGQRPTQLSSI